MTKRGRRERKALDRNEVMLGRKFTTDGQGRITVEATDEGGVPQVSELQRVRADNRGMTVTRQQIEKA
jgi:hypothetical protein